MKTTISLLSLLAVVFSATGLFAFETTGFQNPYGVIVDEKTGFIYVSNTNGLPDARDDNGFISRLKGDGTVDQIKFVDGAAKEITLHAPKGMAIIGTTLYVADIDKLHAFDLASGKQLFDVNFGNLPIQHFYDVCLGPDNALYLADGPGSVIYHINLSKMHEVTPFASGEALGQPRSVMWYQPRQIFIVGATGSGQVLAFDQAGKRQFVPAISFKGPGGMAADDAGNIYITSPTTPAIYRIAPNFALFSFVLSVSSPTDAAWQASAKQIIITSYDANIVQSMPAVQMPQ